MSEPKKYSVVYADPPWSYKNIRTGGTMKSGAAANYKTLTLEEICEIPVQDICDKNSVLFLWAVVPMLPDAFKVLEAWGFKYKTMITWRKIMSLGMGFWFRGQTEHLLVATRGNIKAFRCQHPNFIQSKAGKHSEKPAAFRRLILESTKNIKGDRIELFARGDKSVNLFGENKFDGWDVFGNEVQDSINQLQIQFA